MKNADMPAMPLSGDAYQDFANYDETKNTSYNPWCQGLTKREHFAAMAMQGLLSATNEQGEWTGVNCAAIQAVKEADALLAELERAK